MAPNNFFDNNQNPVVGIDLGTTYSCIARWDGRNPDVYQGLDRAENKPEIPSVVYMQSGGNIVVGSVANRYFLQDPENGVAEIKREMGSETCRVSMRENQYTPVDISSFILGKIRDEIYARFPQGQFEFGGVVVTHPFYFKGPQIEDTRKAAEKAGLNLLGLVPEPVAAALTYALHYFQDQLQMDRPETLLVFDLGGGTFDTTLFELRETQEELIFKGLCTGGDARLGGMDFNRALMDYVLSKENLSLESLSARERVRSVARISQGVDVAKRELSVMPDTQLTIADVLPGRHIERDMNREEFQRIFKGEEGGRNFYQDIQEIVESTLHKANNPKVDKVLLVGGSTRLPLIKDHLLPEILPDTEIYSNISESLAVAMGAAIYAAHLDGRLDYSKKIVIIPPGYAHDLGVRTNEGRFARIISSNAPLPAGYTQTFITPENNCKQLSIEVLERDDLWTGDSIEEGLEAGRIMSRGKITIDHLPEHKKGELEICVRLTVARSDQVSVHIEVFHHKEKVREIDEDLKREG